MKKKFITRDLESSNLWRLTKVVLILVLLVFTVTGTYVGYKMSERNYYVTCPEFDIRRYQPGTIGKGIPPSYCEYKYSGAYSRLVKYQDKKPIIIYSGLLILLSVITYFVVRRLAHYVAFGNKFKK